MDKGLFFLYTVALTWPNNQNLMSLGAVIQPTRLAVSGLTPKLMTVSIWISHV